MAEEVLELKEVTIAKDKKLTIYIDRGNIREVVKELGYIVDQDEEIAFKDTNEKVLSAGHTVKLDEIGAILPANSPHVFIRNNLGSLSTYVAEKE